MYQILDLIIDLLKGKSTWLTRMHSRRMRTARFIGCLYREGLSVSESRGCLPLGLRGVSATPPFTSPPCGQTNTCENITLPQISSAGGNNNFGFTSLIYLPWCNSNSMNSIYTLQLEFNSINSSWCWGVANWLERNRLQYIWGVNLIRPKFTHKHFMKRSEICLCNTCILHQSHLLLEDKTTKSAWQL